MKTFQQLLLTVPHHMDVLDAHELKPDVRIVVLILVAFSCSPICHRIQLEIQC